MKTCIFPLSQTVPTGVLRQGVNFANTSTSLTPHLALCPSYMRPTNLLTKVMMLRVFSLTSRKHLTKFGTTVIIFKLTENGISGNLPKLQRDFLCERRQHVFLNREVCTWANVTAGVPEVSILGPLLFLIYINDLSEGLSTNANLFADDTSLFSVLHDSPGPNKQAQEFIFSRKTKKLLHPSMVFNNANITQSIYQNHLGIILDSKLTFEKHVHYEIPLERRFTKSQAQNHFNHDGGIKNQQCFTKFIRTKFLLFFLN